MESSLAFMDDLLDFSSDIGEEDEEDDVVPSKATPTAAAAADSSELNGGFHPEDSSSCRILPVSLFFSLGFLLFSGGFVNCFVYF